MKNLKTIILLSSIWIFVISVGVVYADGVYAGKWCKEDGSCYDQEPSYGSPSSSGGGNGKGGILWRLFNPPPDTTPKPVYNWTKDYRRFKRLAKQEFKNSDWDGAAADASNYLELTGWKDKGMLYLYARAKHLELEEWVRKGRLDETWEWRYGKAVESYEKLLRLYPKDKKGLKSLQELHAFSDKVEVQREIDVGYDFEIEERWEEAAEAFRRVIALDDSYSYAYGRLGWCLTKMGKHNAANQAYKNAISRGAKKPFVYGRLIMELMKDSNQLDEAIEYVKQGIKEFPDTEYLHQFEINLVGLLLASDRLDEAEKLIADIKHNNPDSPQLEDITRKLRNAHKDRKEAAEVVAIADWRDRSNKLIESSQFKAALKLAKQAQKKYPDNKTVQYEADFVLKQIKRYKDTKKAAVLVDRSYELREADRLEEALAIALQAKENFPNAVTARQAVGRTLTKMKRYDEANEVYARAAYLDRSDSNIVLDQSENRYEQGEYGKALFFAELSLDFDPENEKTKLWVEKLRTIVDKQYSEEENALIQEMAANEPTQIQLQTSTATLGMKKNMRSEVDLSNPKKLSEGSDDRAIAQIKSVEHHSTEALKGKSTEAMKREASLGFDTAGTAQGVIEPLELKGVPVEWKSDPVIPEAHKSSPEIIELVEKRTKIRVKRKELEKKIKALKGVDKPLDVENKTLQENPQMKNVNIAKLKTEITNIENEEYFLNFSIKERIRTSPKKTKVPAEQ